MSKYPKTYSNLSSQMRDDFEVLRYFEKKCGRGFLLDVGCCSGRLIEANFFNPLILVDNDKSIIKSMKAKLAHNKKNKFISANAMQIPMPDKSINGVIFALSALAEMPPLTYVLHEMYRLLKDNGKIFIHYLNPQIRRNGVFPARGLQECGVGNQKSSYSINVLPTPTLGKHAFQIHVNMKYQDGFESIVTNQTLPDIDCMKFILKSIGFSVVDLFGCLNFSSFDKNKSPYIVLIAEKIKKNTKIKPCINKKYLKSKNEFVFEMIEEQKIITGSKFSVILDINSGLLNIRDNFVSNKKKIINKNIFNLCFNNSCFLQDKDLYRGSIKFDIKQQIPIPEEMIFDFILITFQEDIKKICIHKQFKELVLKLHIGGEIWCFLDKKHFVSKNNFLDIYQKNVMITEYKQNEKYLFLKIKRVDL